MIGYKLTPDQADKLIGKTYDGEQLFNPVPDINGDLFVFDGEVLGCTNEEFQWVKELPALEYVQPVNNGV